MNRKRLFIGAILVLSLFVLSGLAISLPSLAFQGNTPAVAQVTTSNPAVAQAAPNTNQSSTIPQNSLIAAFQGTLEQIYSQVNPSVVAIEVVQGSTSSSQTQPGSPFGPTGPQQVLGSGFVWDAQGHIVTNNHVVAGATEIQVVFADGTTVSATVVGTDPQSDLAVIQVNPANLPQGELQPVQMANSDNVKVGQMAIAIGNPFGEQGTMTVGIISGLGRLLPVSSGATSGANYSIPDIIQTDAPINPGNSGGVLVNDQGQVIGVPSAIDSPVQANSGVGFAIPSNIVNAVVPSLISTGTYQHPYVGIGGTTLTPDLAQAMNLPSTQRGALVVTVVPGGPAAQAGLQPSNNQVDISGFPAQVGGDVIVAINGQTINTMDQLIAYLADNTSVGQTVTLTILRNGSQQTVSLTLAARPTGAQASTQTPQNQQPQGGTSTGAYLGIQGLTLDSQIDQAMNLPANQQGVLVELVQSSAPAAQAGLQGSTQTVNINGQQVGIGGDVITALNGQAVNGMQSLAALLRQYSPGQTVTLTILRSGSQMQVSVTLGQSPVSIP
jgi:serine protease Do